MSYTLQAIVGSRETLDAGELEQLAAIDMGSNLRMVPLTADIRERYEIASLPLMDEGVVTLPQSLESLCRRLSRHGLVAYLEAEFFGGSGTQAHALFKDGFALGPPLIDSHAINQALRLLGVQSDGHHDEFNAIGLGRHRETDDWASECQVQARVRPALTQAVRGSDIPARAIGILRWTAVAALALGFFNFLGRAGGHIEMDVNAKANPFLLSYQGKKEAGVAVASALCVVAAALLIRRRPRHSRLGVLFLALAAFAAAEPFVARYLGAERCRRIGGQWSDQFCSCSIKAPGRVNSD
jgi:hypothetical protein